MEKFGRNRHLRGSLIIPLCPVTAVALGKWRFSVQSMRVSICSKPMASLLSAAFIIGNFKETSKAHTATRRQASNKHETDEKDTSGMSLSCCSRQRQKPPIRERRSHSCEVYVVGFSATPA